MRVTQLRGARTHNLRGIDLDLRPGELVAIAGPSGAGKSSLAFGTLYAEGQRRYVESFSAYARQFLERLARPPVDSLEPVPAGVAVDRQAPVRTSRSTVGTMTEIADYAKSLWSRASTLHCRQCGNTVHRESAGDAVASVLARARDAKVVVTYPVRVGGAEEFLGVRDALVEAGYRRVVVDGELRDLDQVRPSDVLGPQARRDRSGLRVPSRTGTDREAVRAPKTQTRADVAGLSVPTQTGTDREAVRAPKTQTRADGAGLSVPTQTGTDREAVRAPKTSKQPKSAKGRKAAAKRDAAAVEARSVTLEVVADRTVAVDSERGRLVEAFEMAMARGDGVATARCEGHAPMRFSRGLHCAPCDLDYRDPTPGLFSFNNPVGACERCRGFGRVIGTDWKKLLPDPRRTLAGGAIVCWNGHGTQWERKELRKRAELAGVPMNVPLSQLTEEQLRWLKEGDGIGWPKGWWGIRGWFEWMESRAYKMHVRMLLARYRSYEECPACRGARLKPDALLYRIGDRTLPSFFQLPARDALAFAHEARALLSKNGVLEAPTDLVLTELETRLGTLCDVGLPYVSLDRTSRTLSGGESQRVALTSALASSLTGAMFVLDEPTVGLHPGDVDRLTQVVRRLAGDDNLVVCVEHDPEVIAAADRVVELGPGAGEHGGRIVFDGTPAELAKADTATGRALRHTKEARTRPPLTSKRAVEIRGASGHNLRGVDARFPVGGLTVVTGPSGSGKSTLVLETLVPAVLRSQGDPAGESGLPFASMTGAEALGVVSEVDQSPLGRTSRGNPATYLGVWDVIRKRLAREPLAKARGYQDGYFSFNVPGGRCETCKGDGAETIEMQFLADVTFGCPDCAGKRFVGPVLDVKLLGLDAAEILALTASEALAHFAKDKLVAKRLSPMVEVGLGYLRLGQSLNTLSGGEAQRLKLALALSDAPPGGLVVLDEPTAGLHAEDVKPLLRAIDRLVTRGDTVVVVEHDMRVAAHADWVIDMGPGGGDSGGAVVGQGTPEEIARSGSRTAPYLAHALGLDAEARNGEAGERERERDKARDFSKEGRKAGTEGIGEATNAAVAARSVGPWQPPSASASSPSPAATSSSGSVPAFLPSSSNTFPSRSPSPSPSPASSSAASSRSSARRAVITVAGAREHNLKDLSLEIPREKLVTVTGPSGSGKSTLAFDVVFAEGQRRFLETLSPYARQYLPQLPRADVDRVLGVPPTVALEQRIARGGANSTVATVTEVAHYLRLLWAKAGQLHCPDCKVPITARSPALVAEDALEKFGLKTEIAVLAPVVRSKKGHYREQLEGWRKKGFAEARIDGTLKPLEAGMSLARFVEHDIELVVERVRGDRAQLESAVRRASDLGEGSVVLLGKGEAALFSTKRACPSCGTGYPELDPRFFSFNTPQGRCPTCEGAGGTIETVGKGKEIHELHVACDACHGSRLSPLARAVTLDALPITAVLGKSVEQARKELRTIKLEGREDEIGRVPLAECERRLAFLEEVGLGYLGLDRPAQSLSGGETQRVRLAAQLGAGLTGLLYVLDEPTIGLHPRDTDRLVSALRALVDRGNSVLVVEHDAEVIRASDHVIDIGPEGGKRGGRLLAAGPPAVLAESGESITGRSIARAAHVPERRAKPKDWLKLRGARGHNLRGVDVDVPLGRLVVVTGVSGSGKSTLVRRVLLPAVRQALELVSEESPMPFASLKGAEFLERAVVVDQTPIGRTPRSVPATYVGVWDEIRRLFAATPDARARGWEASRFSFNVAHAGRCPTCEGNGALTVEMNFLPDVHLPCETCRGMRFTRETLSARLHGLSAGEILKMEIGQAAETLASLHRVARPLVLLAELGLGYLELGQPSHTLSGGEAQRIKLVAELGTGAKGKTLYVLDEPTTGLHREDVTRLLRTLQRFVERGDTVVVVEHQTDLILAADWVVDLGPEGGDGGGNLVVQGTPEEVAAHAGSHTGAALRAELARSGVARARKKNGASRSAEA